MFKYYFNNSISNTPTITWDSPNLNFPVVPFFVYCVSLLYMIIFWALFCHLAVLNSVPLDQKSHGFVLHFVLVSIGSYDNNLLSSCLNY